MKGKKRPEVFLTLNGVTMSAVAWAEQPAIKKLNLNATNLRSRKSSKTGIMWTDKQALSTPLMPRSMNKRQMREFRKKYRLPDRMYRGGQSTPRVIVEKPRPAMSTPAFIRKFRAMCATWGIDWRDCV